MMRRNAAALILYLSCAFVSAQDRGAGFLDRSRPVVVLHAQGNAMITLSGSRIREELTALGVVVDTMMLVRNNVVVQFEDLRAGFEMAFDRGVDQVLCIMYHSTCQALGYDTGRNFYVNALYRAVEGVDPIDLEPVFVVKSPLYDTRIHGIHVRLKDHIR